MHTALAIVLSMCMILCMKLSRFSRMRTALLSFSVCVDLHAVHEAFESIEDRI